ncbi:4-(cytidine 5'-diphospho)-2-C-methyl-D-erythritol kinase [Cellulomonas sp. APG4]|uniref:4-(cytidine 5'-diphospho)-2-C-methyl-D-erythritol kinase n=1 Tax=Cellulomonas sp. APG4 TaxID=1538656 RepID=UPI001379B1FC|nr:4-(cytidine 5'-diphospho)-2-C-methyl-D-erythritol kinase [Cellulomonas sp. APG4]NCT92341.1 4-(cytidine 5'-diphospho)-2-C-methyl-D-erythritol kinase [Cellulomonas sp. APG4]
MSPRPAADGVRVRAPGKINLTLGVGRRREDGYHPLATVFQAVSAFEDVTAWPAEDRTVTVSGLHAEHVPTDGANLALQAADLLARITGVDEGVALHLHKGVPVAGGMGGGSADAAATLVACDALWRTGMSRAELTELGAQLGADVPFALAGQTAVGRGRGDALSPAMTRGEYHWTLALRSDGLSTARAYGVFDELLAGAVDDEPDVDPAVMRALRAGDLPALGAALSNDLQAAALEVAPEIAETLAVAEDAGALGVVVSGSGPTVAALARSQHQALAIAAAITAAGVADDVMCVSGPVAGARVIGTEVRAAEERG